MIKHGAYNDDDYEDGDDSN